MCHRKLNIPYNFFSTKIKSYNYRNDSYLYSPFNMGVNVFRYHVICEYLTWQLIPATIYSQGHPCSYKMGSAKPPRKAGLRGLSICLLLQRPRAPDEGEAWLGRCAPGRGLEGRDGQSRPGPARMPRAGPTPVRRVRVNQAAEGRRRPQAGPIKGVKSVFLLTRQKGPTET